MRTSFSIGVALNLLFLPILFFATYQQKTLKQLLVPLSLNYLLFVSILLVSLMNMEFTHNPVLYLIGSLTVMWPLYLVAALVSLPAYMVWHRYTYPPTKLKPEKKIPQVAGLAFLLFWPLLTAIYLSILQKILIQTPGFDIPANGTVSDAIWWAVIVATVLNVLVVGVFRFKGHRDATDD